MDSGDSQKCGDCPFQAPEANDAEWHSISLGETERSETEYCFLLTDGEQVMQPSTKLDLSMCGLSKLIGRNTTDESDLLSEQPASNMDCKYISIKASKDQGGVNEVRVSIHGLEDSKKCSQSVIRKKADRATNDSAPILGHGDDGCLPLLQQVRAFIKGAKLSCTGLLSGDSNLFSGWSTLLPRSFSFKSSETFSTEGESLCRKSNSSAIRRTTSAPIPATSVSKIIPLQARDPASRAEALPLAHYRPTDGAIRKDGEVTKTGLSTAATSPIKSPVNCKKPPKPPRYPGRSASLDSAAMAVQRAARKSRDRASSKRKSRGDAAASTRLTPVVALLLTIAFGVLIVCQGVFVQMDPSYGRNTDDDFVDVGNDVQSSIPIVKAGLPDRLRPIDRHMLASRNTDVSNSGALLSGALERSMADLPWSRSSLVSQTKSGLSSR